MIPAQKNALADAAIYFFVKRALRRSFHRIRVRGLDHWKHLDPARPTLALANHTNWWDLWLVHRLTRECPHKKLFGMMEEDNLQHHRFLTRLGAFGVDLSDPRRAVAGVRYASELLKSPQHIVWVFPQGTLTQPGEPLVFKPGAAYLARREPNVQVIPLALRYEFWRESRPEIFLEIGAPSDGAKSSDKSLHDILSDCLQRLDQSILQRDGSGFTDLLPPSLTINKKWEYAQRFFTGRLEGFRAEN